MTITIVLSDNVLVARNPGSGDENTDIYNYNAVEGRPMSSSELDSTHSSSEDVPEGRTFREHIAMYVTKHSLSVTATAELLHLFKDIEVQGIPKNRHALLKTLRKINNFVNKCGGSYKYLGLESGLADFLNNNPTFNPSDNTINLCL